MEIRLKLKYRLGKTTKGVKSQVTGAGIAKKKGKTGKTKGPSGVKRNAIIRMDAASGRTRIEYL